MVDAEEARRRVRQLLLSGDNTLKHRDDPRSAERARERFERAAEVAREAGLEESLLEIIELRLRELPARGADAA